MNIIYLILVGVIFGLYLLFFFKLIYPKREQSWVNRFFPFGLIIACTGLFYGIIIYTEVILHRTLLPDMQLIVTYILVTIMAISVHLYPIPFRGRAILYGLSWGIGLVAYGCLLVFIKFELEGGGSDALGALIFGLWFPLFIIIGVGGAARETKELEHLNVSWYFWNLIGVTIIIFSLITIPIGAALCYFPLLIGGVVECIGGGVLMGIMQHRLRRQRRGEDQKPQLQKIS